ncbi:MAG: hypothetical protein ABIA74_00825 [bacterium]
MGMLKKLGLVFILVFGVNSFVSSHKYKGQFALLDAIKNKDADAVKEILKETETIPNIVTAGSLTPIQLAVSTVFYTSKDEDIKKMEQIIENLIAKGAVVYKPDNKLIRYDNTKKSLRYFLFNANSIIINSQLMAF